MHASLSHRLQKKSPVNATNATASLLLSSLPRYRQISGCDAAGAKPVPKKAPERSIDALPRKQAAVQQSVTGLTKAH